MSFVVPILRGDKGDSTETCVLYNYSKTLLLDILLDSGTNTLYEQ